ncbi:MAG: phosphate signaling complex protein PhoU [Firmicutes bacterium]|nr:phosphate signaling complex protein PhoU [Bacillota bacterium]
MSDEHQVTRRGFHADLGALQQDLLRMGTLVERTIHDAVKSLCEGDLALAERIRDEDDVVDWMELDIQNHCLTLLALQQPMAKDLRVIGTVLKAVTDLERMADHAVDIAKVVLRIQGEPLIKPLIDIPRMAEISRRMLRQALDAFVKEDVTAAETLSRMDDEVDHLFGQIFRELLVFMMEDPRTIKQATHLIFVGQHLERIADHATNLGEWVIYQVTGERKDLND